MLAVNGVKKLGVSIVVSALALEEGVKKLWG